MNRQKTSATTNGHTSLVNSPIEIFPRAQTTYMMVPTGGVMVPIMMLRMNKTPKWRGSIPAWRSKGMRTGTAMTMTARPSRKHAEDQHNHVNGQAEV